MMVQLPSDLNLLINVFIFGFFGIIIIGFALTCIQGAKEREYRNLAKQQRIGFRSPPNVPRWPYYLFTFLFVVVPGLLIMLPVYSGASSPSHIGMVGLLWAWALFWAVGIPLIFVHVTYTRINQLKKSYQRALSGSSERLVVTRIEVETEGPYPDYDTFKDLGED